MKKHLKTFFAIVTLGVLTIVIAFLLNSLQSGVENKKNLIPLEDIEQISAHPDISVDNVVEGETISLPKTITGIVKGNWFFEGSFPVFIKDINNNQLGYGLASSSQNWMTANPIPFTVTLPIVNYQGPATLVFTKDNPSGEPQFDDSYSVNVIIQ